ncbi:MAG: response regulator [Candidatus Aureabacteria bacterium]|nr:response regulator [Candidatus Auribacterota bacterium]
MSKKILIVDDEEYIVKMLELKLKEDGFECFSCTTTKEGIKAAKTFMPDLILMDIMMPNVNGLEATEILKSSEETKHIPILILSAKSMEEDQEKARELGADGFLSKPILPQKLLVKIRKFFEEEKVS